MIVVIKMPGRRAARSKSLHSRPIRKKNIRPSVIVVIKNRRPIPSSLNNEILMRLAAVHINRRQPRPPRNIFKLSATGFQSRRNLRLRSLRLRTTKRANRHPSQTTPKNSKQGGPSHALITTPHAILPVHRPQLYNISGPQIFRNAPPPAAALRSQLRILQASLRVPRRSSLTVTRSQLPANSPHSILYHLTTPPFEHTVANTLQAACS